MATILRHNHYQLSSVVEKQMRSWELSRAQHLDTPDPIPLGVHDFVAVSRRPGSGGAEIATLLAERLGWPVFDRELMHAMAGDDAVRARLYQSMDERDLGWLEEVLRSLMPSEFPRNDYFHRLTSTVLSIARKGSAVFLGRAVDLILPKAAGLRVRITAPMEACIARKVKHCKLTPDEARKEIQRIEQERAQFIENHFDVTARDECRHDLIINSARFTPLEAVRLIEYAMNLRPAAGKSERHG